MNHYVFVSTYINESPCTYLDVHKRNNEESEWWDSDKPTLSILGTFQQQCYVQWQPTATSVANTRLNLVDRGLSFFITCLTGISLTLLGISTKSGHECISTGCTITWFTFWQTQLEFWCHLGMMLEYERAESAER